MAREHISRPKRVAINAHGRLSAVGFVPVACTIADVSATGCRILAKNLLPLPQEVKLTFLAAGIVARCEVAWQKPHTAGLRILEQSAAKHDEDVSFDDERQREEAKALRDRALAAANDTAARRARITPVDR